jgi:hypothetical protein
LGEGKIEVPKEGGEAVTEIMSLKEKDCGLGYPEVILDSVFSFLFLTFQKESPLPSQKVT